MCIEVQKVFLQSLQEFYIRQRSKNMGVECLKNEINEMFWNSNESNKNKIMRPDKVIDQMRTYNCSLFDEYSTVIQVFAITAKNEDEARLIADEAVQNYIDNLGFELNIVI